MSLFKITSSWQSWCKRCKLFTLKVLVLGFILFVCDCNGFFPGSSSSTIPMWLPFELFAAETPEITSTSFHAALPGWLYSHARPFDKSTIPTSRVQPWASRSAIRVWCLIIYNVIRSSYLQSGVQYLSSVLPACRLHDYKFSELCYVLSRDLRTQLDVRLFSVCVFFLHNVCFYIVRIGLSVCFAIYIICADICPVFVRMQTLLFKLGVVRSVGSSDHCGRDRHL